MLKMMWRKGNSAHWWECKFVQLLWKTMDFPQKIKNRTTIWSSDFILFHMQRKWKHYLEKIYAHMFITALFTVVNIWKQPKCPAKDECIKKLWDIYICIYTHMYMFILFSHKKWGNPTICNNMNGPWTHYAVWNKSGQERQILYDFTYRWNLKKQKQNSPKPHPTHRKRDQICSHQRRGWGEG